MSNLNSIQRLLGAACAGLALCALSFPAAAQQAQQEAVSSSDAVVVTRDTDGRLRPATAAEQASLQAGKVRLMRAATPSALPKTHASGARGARLTDEFLTSSVAVRGADGKIQMECHDPHGGTEHAAHVHAATAANTPVTE